MPTAYTSLLGLALPVTGELSGTWGDTVNNSITSLLDTSVAGTTNVSTDADVTLTTTTGASNTARQAILLFSGARTALRTVTAPAQSKIYTVINATTGGFSVKLVGAGPTTGVTIVAGESAVCAWNGSDFVKVSNTGGSASFVNLTASGTVTFTGLTASQAVFTNASDELVSNAITGTGSVVMSASPTLTGTIGAAAATLSGNLTLSGGTANGVAYLNGSKVVTSGSALTYNGTDFEITTGALSIQGGRDSTRALRFPDWSIYNSSTGNGLVFDNGSEQMRLTSTGLGIGTSSPSAKLHVAIASGPYVARFENTSTSTSQYNTALFYQGASGSATGYIGTGGSAVGNTAFANNFVVGTQSSNPLVFNTNDTERMRLDTSGNLGIGTSSPASKLDVSSSAEIARFRTSTARGSGNGYFGFYDPTGRKGYYGYGGSDDSLYIANEMNAPILFITNSSEGMRLNSTGLGIGTSSPAAKLDVSQSQNGQTAVQLTNSNAGASTEATFIANNGTYIGSFGVAGASKSAFGAILASDAYIFSNANVANTGITLMANSANGVIKFATGGSTEKMRLDTSGNLGLGVTPSAWATYTTLQINNGAVSNYSPTQDMRISSNAYYNAGWKYIASAPACQYLLDGSNGGHQWFTAPSGTAGNAITFTQAMTLAASGGLSVGTTTDAGTGNIGLPAGGKLRYSSTAYITPENNVSGAEISTTGVITFLTGTGTPTERTRIDASGDMLLGTTTNNFASRLVVFNDNSYTIESQRTTTASEGHMAFANANGAVGSIFTNGTATSFNTSSDYRLKNTITPMTGALAKVALLKPVTYKWNADGSDGQGFIAHELAEVCPQAVTGEKDAVDAKGNPQYQGIDVSFLVATLTAAIKEQQAIIESLKARLDAANL